MIWQSFLLLHMLTRLHVKSRTALSRRSSKVERNDSLVNMDSRNQESKKKLLVMKGLIELLQTSHYQRPVN
jgi:hypothetical protein